VRAPQHPPSGGKFGLPGDARTGRRVRHGANSEACARDWHACYCVSFGPSGSTLETDAPTFRFSRMDVSVPSTLLKQL
jgi:hypothetical protein